MQNSVYVLVYRGMPLLGITGRVMAVYGMLSWSVCYGWLSILFRGWVHSSIGHSSCLFPCWTQLNRADRSQVFSIMSTEDKGPTNNDSADYDDDLERGSLFQEEAENQARGVRPTGLYEVDESRFLGRIGQIIDDKLRGFSSQKPKYEFKRKGE